MKAIYYIIKSKNKTIKDCYIGCTANFKKREYAHKCHCNNNQIKKLKLYTFINENGRWDEWEMLLIEESDFETKKQCFERERFWIEMYDASLNKIKKPIRYIEEKRDYTNKYNTEYRNNNKEYYKNYRETHKEGKKEYNKTYYEKKKNKNKIVEIVSINDELR